MIETPVTDPVSALLEAERRIVRAQERYDTLAAREGALEIELQSLHDELDGVVRQLEARGRGRVEFGDLRRTTPLSPVWGLDRGVPLDRYYIHAFLDRHREDIRGRVLEIKDSGYTRRFGDERVTSVDVLDVDPANPQATIVADLSQAGAVAGGTYDCFILTQTLGVIYDAAAAVGHAIRLLKPGGVLLCTLPASGRISYEEGLGGDYWRFTEASVRRLFGEVLPADSYEVTGHGNVLVGAAFLFGMAVHELTREELDAYDPYFPVVYTVRAVKPAAARGAVLTYHRVGDRTHEGDTLSVPPADFEAQMRHLRDGGYRVLPLDEMVAAVAAGAMPPRAVSLTFDDGYSDALSHVSPILESFGFPATFFVVGSTVDEPCEFWWDTVDRILLTGMLLPPLLELTAGSRRTSLATRTPADRRRARDAILEGMYPLDHETRDGIVRALLAWSGADAAGDPARRPMTADELASLAARPGMAIGAHSQHHEQLPALDPAARRADLRTCRARLESVIGRPVTALSYPYGYADEHSVRAAREAGFELAVTTEARPLTRGVDPLLLPRLDIGGGGVESFKRQLDALWEAALPEAESREPIAGSREPEARSRKP